MGTRGAVLRQVRLEQRRGIEGTNLGTSCGGRTAPLRKYGYGHDSYICDVDFGF